MASKPNSDGLQPTSDGLHFSAFPQDTGTAACGGGDQKRERLHVTAQCPRCQGLERRRGEIGGGTFRELGIWMHQLGYKCSGPRKS